MISVASAGITRFLRRACTHESRVSKPDIIAVQWTHAAVALAVLAHD
jgi:hypothetical protein